MVTWDDVVALGRYGAVLIRLEALLEDVRELVLDSWLLAAPKRLATQLRLPE